MKLVRPIRVVPNYMKYAEGSCLFEMGDTKVICTATITNDVPDHAKASRRGWLSAEYSMLPRATTTRSHRGRIASGGRTKEISRLIGRSLRAVIALEKIPDLGIAIDCDVIQADGGTRTASINGAFVAMVKALRQWDKEHPLPEWPVIDYVGAISVGIVDGKVASDLDYEKDVRADVDLNVVMTGRGEYVEIQGTAEHKSFSHRDLEKLLKVASQGIRKVLAVQKKTLGEVRR